MNQDTTVAKMRKLIEETHLKRFYGITAPVVTNKSQQDQIVEAQNKIVVSMTKLSTIIIDPAISGDARRIVARTIQFSLGVMKEIYKFPHPTTDQFNEWFAKYNEMMWACGFTSSPVFKNQAQGDEGFRVDEDLVKLFKAVSAGNVIEAIEAIFEGVSDERMLTVEAGTQLGRFAVIVAHMPHGEDIQISTALCEVVANDLNSSFLWFGYNRKYTSVNQVWMHSTLNKDLHNKVAQDIDDQLAKAAHVLINSAVLETEQ